jgi:hypothetical protein
VDQTAASENASAFLIVDDEVVYELAPNSVLNIGRLDTNDIVLDDYKVSREHAVLKCSGGEFIIVDLASTHGTFVNGERVDRAPVGFNDRIQVVSHDLVLAPEMPQDLPGASTPQQPRMARTLDRRLKFFGGLNEFALITLVQFLHQEKQSGLLLLEQGQMPGPRIYFLEGDIIHVTDGENLAELLTRQIHEESLFFYFHHETNFPARTIEEATPNYLMSLCHSRDMANIKDVAAAAAARATTSLAVTTKFELPPPIQR